MSLVARIYLSMGAMVVLLVLVGGFASLRTSDVAGTFVEYRNTERMSQIANDLSQNISATRLAALQYRLTSQPALLEQVSQNAETASRQAVELTESLEGYGIQGDLRTIPDLLDEYGALLAQYSQLRRRRNDLEEVITGSGREAHQKLTEILETALRNNNVKVISELGFAKAHLDLGALYLNRFLASGDIGDSERSADEISEAQTDLSRLSQTLNSRQMVGTVQSILGDLVQFSNAASEAKDVILSQNAHFERMDEIATETSAIVNAAAAAIGDRRSTLGPVAVAMAGKSIMFVSSLVAISVVLSLLIAFFTGRMISRILSKITKDMTELANGNLDLEIDAGDQMHEISKMTDALAVFLQNARAVRDLNAELADSDRKEQQWIEKEQARRADQEAKQLLEKSERDAERARMKLLEDFREDMERVMDAAASGNLSVRMSETNEDANLAKLANLVNGQLLVTETNVTDIISSIGELAKGNLAVRVQGEKQGVFLAMKEDFNASVAALSQTMSKILLCSESVSETSVELKNSSRDMSKRAEDNAATVEETSAAVEEITASIRQVVASAKAADQATQRVRQSADETRAVSTETEASINEMTDASAQINRVVKVIEDIAFQINLLALNAGVEAARAGEAGLGFSVVASEVRALALRSQEAVQEITQVIEQSNLSVEAGAQQVGLSRQALERIISEVEVASGQISEIALAVEQQAKGIEEVNTALRAIDVNAQKNASTLEDMTISSVSLSEEAGQLSSALGEFEGVSTKSSGTTPKTKRAPSLRERSNVPKQMPKDAPKGAVAAPQLAVAVMDDEGWDEF